MSFPVVLVCSCTENSSRYVIQGIVKNGTAQNSAEVEAGVLWNITNKYYSADVLLQPFPDGIDLDNFNKEDVEGVIIYIKNFHGESLVTADKRKQACSGAIEKSEVNILLCDKCNETFPREQAMIWCLENDFQLIELLEQPDASEESCPIKDHYGMERVIQTLHTNVWSNHEIQDGDHSEHSEPVHPDADDINDTPLSEDEDALEHMDEFCKLFSRMSSTSANAASMPSENRREYAEQVVKAFWKAIGGDESELEDNNT